MSNNVHGLTIKDADGKTKAHPLYWVWHEKRKKYFMGDPWYDDVLEFVNWAEEHDWERGDCIRRYNTKEAYSPSNCYVHVRGTSLGVAKGD